jgi:hypothetical protein
MRQSGGVVFYPAISRASFHFLPPMTVSRWLGFLAFGGPKLGECTSVKAGFEYRNHDRGNKGNDLVVFLSLCSLELFASGRINCPADRGSKNLMRDRGPSRTVGETIKHDQSNCPSDSRVQQRTKGALEGRGQHRMQRGHGLQPFCRSKLAPSTVLSSSWSQVPKLRPLRGPAVNENCA